MTSLEVTRAGFREEIAFFLGWGRTASAWDAGRLATIESILQSGYRQFCWQSILPGESAAHQWSFLRPVAQLTTVAAQEDYDLPDDFGSLAGEVFYSANDSVWRTIRHLSVGAMLNLRQQNISDGYPQFASVIPKPSTGTSPQRFVLALSPAPNGAYALKYRYQILPEALDETRIYALGGAKHSETLLQSCLSVAELRLTNEQGPQFARWQQCLAASIAQDRMMDAGYFGYNGDGPRDPVSAYRVNEMRYNGTAIGDY